MNPGRWQKVDEFLSAVLEREAGQRASFLAQACEGDEELRKEVQLLVSAHEAAGSFLETAAIEGISSAPIPEDRDPLIGRVLAHYRLESPLGTGGMGVVYRATDLMLRRDVAIKLLPRGRATNEAAKARFLREARAASALDHPNIGAIYDIGEEAGELFIVMPLYDGESLKQRIAGGALSATEVTDIVRQISLGLQSAHNAGIVHRDIKPANVMVTSSETVKILDFGLAKLVQDAAPQNLTQTGEAVGTLLYMSPEQLRGETVNQRTDLWSLGVVACELLAGGPPFRAESNAATVTRILHADPPSLATVPAVPPHVATLISRLLQKDAAQRPASADEVIAALDAHDSVHPRHKHSSTATAHSMATRATPTPRRKFPRRRDLFIALLVALLGSAVVSMWRYLGGTGREASPRPIGFGPVVAPSIAVLAFADMSPQKDQEYFSDGIAEEILNALAHVEGLHVSGRTSSFSFKGKNEDIRSIGQQLNVAHVLEGSVRKAGSRFRITAQIISVSDGYHLWSQTFERDLADIFAVQDEIARAVVSALKMKLLPAPDHAAGERPTRNIEAYNQYLLGRRFYQVLSNDGTRRAMEAYKKALELDPGYAPAWAGLALAVWRQAYREDSYADAEEARKRALAAAEKAVALDPGISDGYLARGKVRWNKWDWSGAQADLEHALALNGGDVEILGVYALVLGSLGPLPEAIRVLEKAIAIDPLSAISWSHLNIMYRSSGQLGLARSAMNRALEIAPEQDSGPYALGVNSLLEGQPAAALASFRLDTDPIGLAWGAALAEHDLGRPKESQRALDKLMALEPNAPAYLIAAIYAWRGERDRAFDWLERAYEKHDNMLSWVKFDPLLRNLRGDPRYTALLKKMHLPVE